MNAPIALRVTIRSGSEKGRTQHVLSPGIIGRDPTCVPAILLADANVSRRHALLSNQEGRWQVTDLRSANGTFLDGIRLRPEEAYPLGESGRLLLGEEGVLLEYEVFAATLSGSRSRDGVAPVVDPDDRQGLRDSVSRIPASGRPGGASAPGAASGAPSPADRPPARTTDPGGPVWPGDPHQEAAPASNPPDGGEGAQRGRVGELQARLAEAARRNLDLQRQLGDLEHQRAIEAAARRASEEKGAQLAQNLNQVRKLLQDRTAAEQSLRKELEAAQRTGGATSGLTPETRILAGQAVSACRELASTLGELERTVVADDATGVAQRALARAVSRLGELRVLLERFGQAP